MEINGLKPALTPALPEERENTFPRLDHLRALDLTRFRGQFLWLGIITFPDFPGAGKRFITLFEQNRSARVNTVTDLESFAAGDANAAKAFSLSTGRRRRSSRSFSPAGANPAGIFFARMNLSNFKNEAAAKQRQIRREALFFAFFRG